MNEPDPIQTTGPTGDEKELRLWSTLLHLSLLSGLVIPFGGLLVPIVIYVIKKDDLPGLQPHWYVVLNWMISAVIYAAVSMVLMLVLIGLVLIWVVIALSLIFPIIGAIKANDGEVWPYPLTIRFFGNR